MKQFQTLSLSEQQRVEGATAGCDASEGRVQFGGWSDDVFEAEGAVAGEPLALAPAAQVLPVGPLWVNMALRFCTGATRFVARLERKEPISCDVQASFVYSTYMTCDVLYAVRVKFLLAFPTELLEVNLEHMHASVSLESCTHPEFYCRRIHGSKFTEKLLCYLVCALNTPHICTLPSQVAFSAVVIAILLFQELVDTSSDFSE